jgi:hypothetical protein
MALIKLTLSRTRKEIGRVETHKSESEGWSLSYGGEDLLIQGPRGLESVVRHFDQTKIQHNEPLSPEPVDNPAQLGWLYPLQGRITLQLVSSRSPDGKPFHQLHLGMEGDICQIALPPCYTN